MTLRWSNWDAAPWLTESPYVDWFYASPPPGMEPAAAPGQSRGGDMLCFTPECARPPAMPLASAERAAGAPSAGIDAVTHARVPDFSRQFGNLSHPMVPMPAAAQNGGFAAYYAEAGNWAPPEESLPIVDADTVIMGVIDTGIPLGSNRLRNADGTSRILATWTQAAPRGTEDGQSYLPFGTELYRDRLNTLIAQHSIGGLRGHLIEDTFNAAAGLVDMMRVLGHRELAGRAAHGAMVADLAAGAAPGTADPRVQIIAVNLPDRKTINSSGIFLDYFTVYAVKRIADLADLIFDKSSKAAGAGKAKWEAARGFPIVINLSFGKNAGAKDGNDMFNAAIRRINDDRIRRKLLPIQFVIPVGNHNLKKGNVEFTLASGAEDSIAFVAPPEDHSANYLEIWTDYLANPAGFDPSQVDIPLEVEATVPGGQPATPSAGEHMTARKMGDLARLYCFVRMDEGRQRYRVCYLLCTAPTLRQESPARAACPSGRWKIVVRNRGGATLRVFISAQTDQSILPRSGTGRLPWLESAEYNDFEEPSGSRRDSYRYPYDPEEGSLDNSPVLRRHGSISAMAMSSHIVAVAGYCVSDGRPAIYSGTGHGYTLDAKYCRSNPTVAFPSEDSPAQYGIVGAGSANGSVVAMRGTSFASALAARWICDGIVAGKIKLPDTLTVISAAAKAAEAAHSQQYRGRQPPAEKIGYGRIAPHRTSRRMLSWQAPP